MIKIVQLYKSTNKNYEYNGNFNLDNIISSLNFAGGVSKIHDITIEIEFDENELWRNVEQYDVLKLDTPQLKEQLYRIYDYDANDDKLVIIATPLFYDLNKKVILDIRNINASGQEAITKLFQGTEYTGHSNITIKANCNWIKKHITTALLVTEDYSFIKNYGGELWIDNYDITMNTKIGGDYGVQCSYGRDVNTIEKNVNIEGVYTRLIPYADNNLMLLETYVDSPLINNYPIIQELPVPMDDIKVGIEEENFATETLARAEMKKRCLQMFADGLDKPKSNFKVSIESLKGSDEYNDFSNLVNIGIGDTVRIYYKPLGIDLNVRCLNIKAEYIFAKKVWVYTEVELGDAIESLTDKFSNTISIANNANKKIESVTDGDFIIAGRVKGFLDGAQTSLKASKQVGEKQDYRIALSEDLDPSSPIYGAMLWGAGVIYLSNKRTLDNKDWDYTTAITPNGIKADTIIGRLLANEDGTNYFDLDNGIIKGKDLTVDLTNGIIKFVRGLIEGKNLSINLDTGAVNFKKGKIEGLNGYWDLDNGVFNSKKTLNGVVINDFSIEGGALKSDKFINLTGLNGAMLRYTPSGFLGVEKAKVSIGSNYKGGGQASIEADDIYLTGNVYINGVLTYSK